MAGYSATYSQGGDGNNPKDIESQSYESRVKTPRRSTWVKVLGSLLVAATLFTSLYYLYEPKDSDIQGGDHDSSLLSLKELQHGKYYPRSKQINWLSDGADGEYLTRAENGTILISQWGKPGQDRFVVGPVIETDVKRIVQQAIPNKDRTKALIVTDTEKLWRHSTFALYWILDIASGKVEAVNPAKPAAKLSIVDWSPLGDKVAFVYENNLYVRDLSNPDVVKVTTDGDANVFNGMADWVYEEEVFASPKAFWWSQNGKNIAYLRTNNTEVPEFPVPYFLNEGTTAGAYPNVVKIKYPKPGYSNPEVDVWIYNLKQDKTGLVQIDTPEEKITSEFIWAGDESLIVKVSNRYSDFQNIVLVDASTRSARVVRTFDAAKDGAWVEISHNTLYVPADASSGRPQPGYVDTIMVNGYRHLGYFSPLDATEPLVLTSGEWEVADVGISVNLKTNRLYFTGTKRSSIDKHIYETSIIGDDRSISAVTPDEDAVFSAKYSSDGSHAVISYQGPGVPWQKVLVTGTPLREAEYIEVNEELQQVVSTKSLGRIRYGQHEVEKGVFVNYREILPSKFSDSHKHPVLFYNYGGPNSQFISRSFTLDFQRVFAEIHNAVIVTVDPRGTDFRGNAFRAAVRDHLGKYEAHDIISVARAWNEKPYIDESTTAIWGWSYGGYMTLKTLETDGGNEFKYGVAVAPVTDWRLYDSVYAERYMHTPDMNPIGYQESAISNVTSIGQNERFLIMHGTGDDNVHFQNTLALLDKFDLNGVENYDVHVFPDSDHSISFHNASPMIYDRLDNWLTHYQLRK